MRQAVGFDGVKALEVKQWIDEARGRRIAVVDRDEIGAKRIADVRLRAQRLVVRRCDGSPHPPADRDAARSNR